jgi:hypothetical protein
MVVPEGSRLLLSYDHHPPRALCELLEHEFRIAPAPLRGKRPTRPHDRFQPAGAPP